MFNRRPPPLIDLPVRSLYCPHCLKHTAVSPAACADAGEFAPRAAARKGSEVWWIGACNACDQPMLLSNTGAVYPEPRPEPTDERVPNGVKKALDEAKRCMVVQAYNAAAAMARRSIQAAALRCGANPDSKLVKQIDWLAEQGKITADLKAWAHEIRGIGNDGAHPPDEATADDATDAIELARAFAEYLFVTPAIIEERRKNR